MSQSVLISTFLSLREAALQRVALAADADAGGDDAIVGAEDAAADVRRRAAAARAEELAADRDARRRRADAGGEFAPRDAVLVVRWLATGHSFHGTCARQDLPAASLAAERAEAAIARPVEGGLAG